MDNTHQTIDFDIIEQQSETVREALVTEGNYIPHDIADKAAKIIDVIISLQKSDSKNLAHSIDISRTNILLLRKALKSDINQQETPFPNSLYNSLGALAAELNEVLDLLGGNTDVKNDGRNSTSASLSTVFEEINSLIDQANVLGEKLDQLDIEVGKDPVFEVGERQRHNASSRKVKLGLNLLFLTVNWEREIDLLGVGRAAGRVSDDALAYAASVTHKAGEAVHAARKSLTESAHGLLGSAKSLIEVGRLKNEVPENEAERSRWEHEVASLVVQGKTPTRTKRSEIRSLDIGALSHNMRETMRRDGVELAAKYETGDMFSRKLDFDRVSLLSSLTNLQVLRLKQTRVKNISSLARLKELRVLDLSISEVEDIAALRKLDNLEELFLTDTLVEDLQPLAALRRLTKLTISGTRVNDLSPLHQLKNLTHLKIDNTGVIDLNDVSFLTGLISINFASTRITSLAPLSSLGNLREIYMSATRVSDLSHLKYLSKLELVDCRTYGNEGPFIRDFSPVDHVARVAGRS